VKLYLAIFLILCANAGISQSGDSVRTKTPPPKIIQDTIIIPFDTNYIKSPYRLSNTSETFGVSNWIWNDKRNLGEILNERPGYHINFITDGGRSILNYNRTGQTFFGVFKDGIQINDNFFGGFDIENISVNEIDTIEEISLTSSFLYGINTQGKAINIITKDVFQPELFSQLRFTQDRYGSENAEIYFSQSLSRKLNWQIGANKHSLSGRYANSDFDVWRARFRTNWFISPKANVKFNLNYANIRRGLNGGLFNNSEDTLRNPEFAKVRNPDSYEKLMNFFYDISFTGRLFKNKNSLTKIKLYSQNSLREYRDEEGSGNTNGILETKNFHTIQYAVDLKQNFSFSPIKDVFIDFLMGGNVSYNIFDYNPPYYGEDGVAHFTLTYYTAFSRADLKFNNISASLMGRYEQMIGEKSLGGGIELGYDLFRNNDLHLNIFGGINLYPWGLNYYYLQDFVPGGFSPYYSLYEFSNKEIGLRLRYKWIYLNLSQYNQNYIENFVLSNGNYEAGIRTKYIDITSTLNYRSDQMVLEDGVLKYNLNAPKFFLKSDISFHDFLFQNNLNLRIGVNIKYLNDFYAPSYNELRNKLYESPLTDPPGSTYVDHLFNMDFYIGARIGSANISFTFANIFDNFNYDTFLYPWDDRGGAFNSLSRFSITWDFLD
jgi:hypothetical protein